MAWTGGLEVSMYEPFPLPTETTETIISICRVQITYLAQVGKKTKKTNLVLVT